MKYNFDDIVSRRNTNSVKWGDSNEDSLEMWVADMDFKVLPEIKEAIKAKADIDAYGYCYAKDEYFDAYIYWWKHIHKLELKKEWMIFSQGVVGSIDSILKRYPNKGDGVVMFTPTYNVFFNCIKNNGLKLYECDFIYKDNKYLIDWDKLESLLKKDDVKVLLFCNPQNPSGTIYSKEELIRVAKLAKENNALIVSDEIHCDITHPDKEYVPFLLAAKEYQDNIVTLISPTKAFNLAGLQTSCIVSPNKKLYELISQGIGADDLGDSNYFACEAAIAAFTKGEEYNKELRKYIFTNKKYVEEFFKSKLPGMKIVDGDATYLMWVDVSRYVKDVDAFTKDLKEKTGIHICSGLSYGRSGASFVRINVATSLDNVKEFCSRLEKYLINK